MRLPRATAARRRSSDLSPIGCLPFSQFDTVEVVACIRRANSTPDQPSDLRRYRISAGVSCSRLLDQRTGDGEVLGERRCGRHPRREGDRLLYLANKKSR